MHPGVPTGSLSAAVCDRIAELQLSVRDCMGKVFQELGPMKPRLARIQEFIDKIGRSNYMS